MNYVISLGGSVIVPGQIDTTFVRKFVALIRDQVKRGHKFFIVTGGGSTARKYIQALREFGRAVAGDDLDWIGISATKMNAQLLHSVFGRIARKGLLTDPSERKTDLRAVNLACGWKPGWSTDYVAARLAATYGVQTVINLSNIDYVYDSDPKKNRSAKKFTEMSWGQYLKLFGRRWDPGANFPFDPVGAALAQKNGLRVVVMNGKKLNNLKNFFQAKKFLGTEIT